MRQRKPLDVVHSAHRFLGAFENRELEVYNVAPQMDNEFKGKGGEEVCLLFEVIRSQYYFFFTQDKFNLKELRIGIKFNVATLREQLVMMVGEYRYVQKCQDWISG